MRPSKGYTIVEVLLVVVILAIIGTLAGPRFFDNTSFDERAYYDELVSALRYAQKIAVASGCPVRVTIASTSYALAQQSPLAGHCDPGDATFPVAVRLSTGEAVSGTAPANVSAAPAITIVYNALGQTNLAASQSIAVGSRLLQVQADSGLVVTP